MIETANPAFILIIAGIIATFLPLHFGRKLLMIGAPALALLAMNNLYWSSEAASFVSGTYSIAGIDLTLLRIDRLSYIWGCIFGLAGVINGIFALHERCKVTDSSALLYTGAGIGAVFAGDLITLFFYWEILALSSVFLVWRGGERSYAAGMRYLGMHVLSGVLLLAGAVIYGRATGSYDFNAIGLDAPGGLFILIAIGIKAGFPLLHNWIQDAYPKSSVTGTVILSVFSTKLAIYALARGYAGEEILIYIGAAMAVFPVFFAVMENDLRKVLSYSLNNQLGFMVCGIGVGTTLALNGVAAQVVLHVLFKGILFMSMGAVLYRVGTAKASELGGLFRSMPLTTVFCLIGAGSISAFPLMGGFVSKSMIVAAVFAEHHYFVYALLLFASAGVLEHSGIKVPYFAFFAHDSGKRPKEAPWNMLLAMGIGSFLCLFLAYPTSYHYLFNLLPHEMVGDAAFNPYTAEHVVLQMQLLMGAMLAFNVLMRTGLYPPERRAEILDFDWFYRRFGLGALKWGHAVWTAIGALLTRGVMQLFKQCGMRLYHNCSPAGALSKELSSGFSMAMVAVMLFITLLLVYLV